MNNKNCEVFFSIATKVDLKENHHITIKIINTVLDYFKKVTDQKFMMCYVDSKSFRKNNVTEKNYEKLIERLKNKEVFSFIAITKRLTNEEYFGIGNIPEFEPEFGCILNIGEPNSLRELGDTCDSIKMCFPTSFSSDIKNQNDIIELMKELQKIMEGLCSFITIGTFRDDYSMDCGLFDSHYYPTSNQFSMHWNEYVRGYFWGQCLTPYQVEKLGGIEIIQDQEFYLCEEWDDCVYIQSTEKILDHTLEDALKMRTFLKPLFPPKSEKRLQSYPSKEDFKKHSQNKLYFFADEDLVLEEE